jgi:hypothetical protein
VAPHLPKPVDTHHFSGEPDMQGLSQTRETIANISKNTLSAAKINEVVRQYQRTEGSAIEVLC